MLIAPAIVIDLIIRWADRTSRRAQEVQIIPDAKPVQKPWWRDWLLALVIALVFVAIAFAVQWPFSSFLLSDAADNRFFARSGHWPYFAKPGDWMNQFWTWDNDPITRKGIWGAYLRAFLVIAAQQDAGDTRAHFHLARARGLADVLECCRHRLRLDRHHRHRRRLHPRVRL